MYDIPGALSYQLLMESKWIDIHNDVFLKVNCNTRNEILCPT